MYSHVVGEVLGLMKALRCMLKFFPLIEAQ